MSLNYIVSSYLEDKPVAEKIIITEPRRSEVAGCEVCV